MTSPIDQQPRAVWYRLPIVWFSGLCLLAVLLGCAFNIITAMQHADAGLQEIGPSSKFQLPHGVEK